MRDGKVNEIFQVYFNGCIQELNLPEEDRCAVRSRGTLKGARCLKPKDHSGQCQWTPKNGVSLSTCAKIMGRIAPHAVMCLAGLDDIAVTKGYENFKRLINIITSLNNYAEDLMSEEMKQILLKI
mgnify:CR=1 FL=1